MTFAPGDPAPWFKGETPTNPEYHFDTVAGRYVLLLFLPREGPARNGALVRLIENQDLFDDVHASAFVVARDPLAFETAKDGRGIRWFLDRDGAISRLYGADGAEDGFWLALDPALRVLWQAHASVGRQALKAFRKLPPPASHAGGVFPAPILVLPRVFEPELCQRLVALHQAEQARFTGVMRDRGEVTVAEMDELKRRRDVLIEDPALQAEIRTRLEARVFPMIARAFNAKMTQIERYLVSCYAADDGGVFHAHRDNVTYGTAHRRFACSINLNNDFEGGDLRFPEFGPHMYRPPVGGAVVFGCALLHEAMRVTKGRRYAFLPFFTDAEGEEVRRAYEARVAGRAEPAG